MSWATMCQSIEAIIRTHTWHITSFSLLIPYFKMALDGASYDFIFTLGVEKRLNLNTKC